MMVTTLKVSATSEVKSVAGAIAGAIRNSETVKITSIGAAAVNQAVKSIIVARSYLVQNGINLYTVPSFEVVEINGIKKTAIALWVNVNKDS